MSESSPTPDRQAVPTDWVAAHQREVWRYLRFLGCSPERAEDLTQTALLAAIERDLPARSAAESAAWLRTTARNLLLMELRAERRAPARELVALDEIWQRQVGAGSADAAAAGLVLCLDALPERDRLAIDRRYRDGASRAEMAVELGVGEPAVKQLLRRARERLRACIERRRSES